MNVLALELLDVRRNSGSLAQESSQYRGVAGRSMVSVPSFFGSCRVLEYGRLEDILIFVLGRGGHCRSLVYLDSA